MIRYNWEDIKKHTKNDITKILSYFSNVYVFQGTMYNFLKAHNWAAKIYNSKTEKDSYILNINDLVYNELNATSDEQYVYLDLASKRDIFTYYNTKGKVIFLPYWKIEKYYNMNALKTNRLLMIDSDNIYLIYEGEE
jgi:exosome complex RNA-binding protein Rrp4